MEDMIREIEDRLRDGETPQEDWKYGLKLEHFILDSETKKPLAFEGERGLEQILKNLQYKAMRPITEDGILTGLVFTDYVITLQPGGQIEIGINPAEALFDVRQRYMDARRLLNRELEAVGAEAFCGGYLPEGSAQDGTVLPTARAEALAAWYEQNADDPAGGKQLMCGIAGTKILIDYDDEIDFVRKFRLAYQISPFIQLIACCCPVYEDEENRNVFLRNTICAAADPQRTGMIPGVYDREFGYERYAEFVCGYPLYCNIDDMPDDAICAGETYPYVRADGEHIEICYLDSMDITEAIGLLAFFKGIFCNKTTVTDLLLMMPQEEEDIHVSRERIQAKGYYAIVYSRALRTWIDMLFEKAHGNLAFEELPLLHSFEQPARARRTICPQMQLNDGGEVSSYYGGGKMIELMQRGNEMRMVPKPEIPEKKED